MVFHTWFTITYWGMPHFLGLSDLPQVSLHFDLVIDPYELHTRAYPSYLRLLDLLTNFIVFRASC